MSTTITARLDEDQEPDGSAGVARSEPGGRAQRRAGAARLPDPDPVLADRVKELLPNELIDQLMAGARTGEEITGQGGLLSQLTKRMVERAMEVELTDHLDKEPRRADLTRLASPVSRHACFAAKQASGHCAPDAWSLSRSSGS